MSCPVISLFSLEAVTYLLFEKPVPVSYAVAVKGQSQSCGAVKEAGCKTSQTAVSESGVLYLLKTCKVYTQLPEYPYAVEMTLESSKNGVKQNLITLRHKGGNVTIPYIAEKDSELILSIAGRTVARQTVD